MVRTDLKEDLVFYKLHRVLLQQETLAKTEKDEL